MSSLKKIIHAFSPFANSHEKAVQTYFKSLTEKSNKTQIIKHLLNLIQKDFASVNLWTEYKYKGYTYLDKQTRKKLYDNLTLIENDFDNFYKKFKITSKQIDFNENILDLRKTSPPLDNANDEVMVDLSGGSDAIATLATEKQAGRVGGVLEGVGILRKSSINTQTNNNSKSEKLALLTCIMNYFSINRGLYIYQESSSFGKLLQNPANNNLVGDCNQIVSLYIHIYARYNPITDLKLRTIPGHVALHFEGQDIETTKGTFADYSNHKNNKILPVYEIVSINLLDVTDAYLKIKPLDPKDLLQSARLAYLLSNNRDVVLHNLNASYGTVINELMKSNNFSKALIFSKQSNDNKYTELIGHNGAIHYLKKHNFNKAKQFADYAKDSQSLKKHITTSEGIYYYNKGNYDLAIKAFSQTNDQELINKCYETLYIYEQNKLPKKLNSENIKNYKNVIHNMNTYAKKSNNKTLIKNINQYNKYL